MENVPNTPATKSTNRPSRTKPPPKDPLELRQLGPYRLLNRIGVGGMGSVYRAIRSDKPEAEQQVVAIKVMSEATRHNPVLQARFEQEFRAASRLKHINMVRALDYGEVAGTPYLVMEFVEGKTLALMAEEQGRLPEAEGIRLVAQVAQGLHRAHKLGLIHRDVKPENILVTPQGQAKLTDLGLVKEADGDLNLTRTGRGLGTPYFMAPEQFKNAKLADPRCDIYSLAATLYAVITGTTPFLGISPLDAWMKKAQDEFTPPRTLVPNLSERTDWAIRRAMASDPAVRPASCREFVEDLTGRTTRKALSLPKNDADNWHLKYQDETGVEVAVRGSRNAVRRSLRDGLLGDASNIQASRQREGTYLPLRDLPEFRDLILAVPAQLPPGNASSAPPALPATFIPGSDLPTTSVHGQPPSTRSAPFWLALLTGSVLLLGLATLYFLLR